MDKFVMEINQVVGDILDTVEKELNEAADEEVQKALENDCSLSLETLDPKYLGKYFNKLFFKTAEPRL